MPALRACSQAAYRIFNTWMGDPTRVLQLEAARRPLRGPPPNGQACFWRTRTHDTDPLRCFEHHPHPPQVLGCVRDYRLVENAAATGRLLQAGLADISARHPGMVANVRGAGTLVAFDAADGLSRDALLGALRCAGVDIPGCGDATVRCRPGLFFGERHAGQFLELLQTALVRLQTKSR